MRSLARAFQAGIVLLSSGICGCAVHPLPEDVAPLNTVEIVEHIRCEMYEALRHQIVLIFDLSDSPAAHDIARQIEAAPERPLSEFQDQIKLLKPVYQKRITAFAGTTIGYGFRFNITEQDVAKSTLNFGLPWNPLSNFTLNATAGLDKKRANTRRFFKVDTFQDLLLSKECLSKPLNDANLIYPITGKIGLDNVVSDFVKLTTRGAKTFADPKDVKNFSEQLTFTTQISGSLNPKVKVSPHTDRFKLADAGVELSATRTDVHELTLTFDVGNNFNLSGTTGLAGRKEAVVNELNQLRFLDAVERGGGAVVPVQ